MASQEQGNTLAPHRTAPHRPGPATFAKFSTQLLRANGEGDGEEVMRKNKAGEEELRKSVGFFFIHKFHAFFTFHFPYSRLFWTYPVANWAIHYEPYRDAAPMGETFKLLKMSNKSMFYFVNLCNLYVYSTVLKTGCSNDYMHRAKFKFIHSSEAQTFSRCIWLMNIISYPLRKLSTTIMIHSTSCLNFPYLTLIGRKVCNA